MRHVDESSLSARYPWDYRAIGPSIIFDKSALQALTLDESVWLNAFFYANIVPLLYVETLGDLEKDAVAGRSPEGDVARLAEKTPSSAFPNAHHRTLILGELAGEGVSMDGRPLIAGGEFKARPDGTVGVHLDPSTESIALNRWRVREFAELEREASRAWRGALAAHDPTRMVALVSNVLPADHKVSDLGQLKEYIDDFCLSGQEEVMRLALEVLDVPGPQASEALRHWQAGGAPPLTEFAPFSAHVFKVDLLYYLGMARGFISAERASNRVDMAYLYYLPFCHLFCSGDKLHGRTAPLFLNQPQSYVTAADLKQALAALDDHYERSVPDEWKEQGVLAFASYPPSSVDNLIADAWDTHMNPGWREAAQRQEALLDQPPEAPPSARELTEELESAEPLPPSRARPAAQPDYAVIKRWVPARKGKWRMVSQEVESASDEEDETQT